MVRPDSSLVPVTSVRKPFLLGAPATLPFGVQHCTALEVGKPYLPGCAFDRAARRIQLPGRCSELLLAFPGLTAGEVEAVRECVADFGLLVLTRPGRFGSVVPKLPGSANIPWRATLQAVEFTQSGKTGMVLEGQTLLDAAAEACVEIPSAYRQGQCGTRKTRLVDGRVRMTVEHGLDPESRARGFALPFVGHAGGNVPLDA
jgi:ferredoxin